jgi:peptidylprolyl isomerase
MATPFPALDGSAPRQQQFDSAPEMGIDTSKRYTATMETSMGTLVIALDAINAPITVNNFVFLAAHHYYDGVIASSTDSCAKAVTRREQGEAVPDTAFPTSR